MDHMLLRVDAEPGSLRDVDAQLIDAPAVLPSDSASIIPSPGSPPPVVNVTTETNLMSGVTTIEAGTQLRGDAIPLFYSTYYGLPFVNKGVMWNDVSGDGGSIISGFSSVDNSGVMVALADTYPDYSAAHRQGAGVVALGSNGSLTNTGTMLAIATNGGATGSSSQYSYLFNNSGVIAASAATGTAIAADFYRGGQLINAAGGKVLAEGANAFAVRFGWDSGGNGAHIKNAGLIEAHSTDPDVGSAAVYFLGYGSGSTYFVENSGTIRGDWAFLADGVSTATTVQLNTITITNLAGGLIEGDIDLNRGQDTIINAGTMHGDIWLGESIDKVDTSAGTLDGIVDLGWGDDSFIGSAGADRVAADDGNDTLTGNAGDDQLMGGGNDDVITGGAGNDGLFGEYGNDRIVTLEGDYVSGGAGNDRIEAGDYKFEVIDGGSGFDTLKLPGTARVFDLASALAEGALVSIEAIELGGSREIVVRPADIPGIADGTHKLRIAGVASDKVDLVGSWTASDSVTIDGTSYRQFVSGAETLLVSGAAVVTIMAAAPPGATGLDPFSGALAPVPGDDGALDFTPNELQLASYQMGENLTVNAEELFWNDGYYVIQADLPGLTLTNHGTIASYTDWDQGLGANTIYGRNLETLFNDGLIYAKWDWDDGHGHGAQEEFAGYTSALAQGNNVENRGLILAETFHGIAAASTQAGNLTNYGEIHASSTYGFAIAVDEADHFANHGDVLAEGGYSAIGVRARYSEFTNDGSIVAKTGAGGLESIGVQFSLRTAGSFTNAGAVVADIAFQLGGDAQSNLYPFTLTNTGMMTGRIEMGVSDDRVINSGALYGDVKLGKGNDVFDGTGGEQNGTVDGGEGNDQLTGGAGNDHLFGGAGVDRLYGMGGADTLIAGDGGVKDPVIEVAATVPRGTKETAINVTGFSLAADPRFGGDPVPHVIVDVKTAGTIEWLHFTVDKQGVTSIYIDHLSFQSPSLHLYDSQGQEMREGGGYSDSANGIYTTSYGLPPGDYYLSIFAYASTYGTTPADGAYRMTFLIPGQTTVPDTVVGSMLDGGGGDDSLFGGASSDTLIGGTGADRMTGGKGDDSYDVDQQGDLVFEDAGGGTDTVTAHASFYLYANIEKLTLAAGAGDIFGVGNESDNLITGNEGANLILGGAGNDEVHGGAGGDQLYGQDGVDTLFGDAGVDYLIGGAGNDVLAGGNDEDALYGEDGDDVLFGGEDFKTDIMIGGAGNDIFHADSGLGDYDLLDGGAGNDTYLVDTFADVTYEAVGGGTDTVYAATVAGSGYYLYANVENLILVGNTFYGVGNELANTMTGNSLDNWLLGGAGNDVLNGKAGNDVLFGQDGADTFVFEHGTGGDTIADFTAGTDKIDLSAFGFTSFAQLQAAMSENGGSSAIILGGGDLIVLQNVTNAQLHAGDFILSGGSAADVPAGALLQAGVTDGSGLAHGRADMLHHFDAYASALQPEWMS